MLLALFCLLHSLHYLCCVSHHPIRTLTILWTSTAASSWSRYTISCHSPPDTSDIFTPDPKPLTLLFYWYAGRKLDPSPPILPYSLVVPPPQREKNLPAWILCALQFNILPPIGCRRLGGGGVGVIVSSHRYITPTFPPSLVSSYPPISLLQTIFPIKRTACFTPPHTPQPS